MAKRVFELAREVSLPTKDMITLLNQLGFARIHGNFNPVPEDAVGKVLAKISPAPDATAAEAAPAGPIRISAPAAHIVVTHAPEPVRQRPQPPARPVAPGGMGPRPGAPGAPGAPGQRPAPVPGMRPGVPAGPGGHRPGGFPPRPGAPGAPPGAPRPGAGAPPKGRAGGRKAWEARKKDMEGDANKVAQRGKKERGRPAAPTLNQVVRLSGSLTVKELSERMGVHEAELIKKLFLKGIMATINQTIPLETAEMICDDMGLKVEMFDPSQVDVAEIEKAEDIDESKLVTRPPVVVIMGHVDHGKTSLLDAIRQTNVVAGEAGGITQHIGAYQVSIRNNLITFLDTPGHEAFTAMRARGAKATDIAVLVVAADDGVKPQTIEAIHHAKDAGVPIIVAINKVDKPGANPDQVKQQLTEFELLAEDWGGQTVMVPVSAKQKTGISELLEMILLVAEVQELRADPDRMARGLVIEAELDSRQGPKATLLVQSGKLAVGDNFVVGAIAGKVRSMSNDQGKRVKEALPSMPVVVTGLSSVPRAGDVFQVTEDERTAKSIAGERAEAERAKELAERAKHLTLGALSEAAKGGKLSEVKEVKIVLRGDVKGSVEAVTQSLMNLNEDDEIKGKGLGLRIILANTGEVVESDVDLAAASNAIVIAFHTSIQERARVKAEQESVEVREYDIIYKLLEDMEAALKGKLEPEYEDVFSGKAEIRKIFTFGKSVIAGSYVLEGKILRNQKAKVLRGKEIVHEGKLDNLKRFKDDAKEVAQGYECGISFDTYHDLKEGDIIEVFTTQVKARS